LYKIANDQTKIYVLLVMQYLGCSKSLHMIAIRLYFIVALLAVGQMAWATHIVGGELTYKCLGNNTYEINLSVYRDCFNGVPPFDSIASIGVFNDQFFLLEELRLPVTAIDDTLDIILTNPCLVAPPDVCVHRTTYTAIVSLPPIPGGYNIVYQRCCRNMLIRNIPLPEDVGITIIAEINDKAIAECNQGAVFVNWPPLAICVNEPIDFDHGAIDADNDSLVYRLCTPLSGGDDIIPMPQPPNPGPYIEVTWQTPPYSLNNLLGGVPLQINPATGFITGIPNTIGNYVVGVCVDEYRDGEVISTTRRDFQYNVADCGVSQAAFFAPELLCDDRTVTFDNNSEIGDLTTNQWYFDYGNPNSATSTEVNPTYTYPDTGRYTVALVLNGAFSCRDTFFQDIWVTETASFVSLDIDYSNCDSSGVQVNLMSTSQDPQHGILAVFWVVTNPNGQFSTSSDENFSFKARLSGQYSATLSVVSNNGCIRVDTIPFDISIAAQEFFDREELICPGDSIELYPNAPDGFTYQWTPVSALSDPSVPNPTVSPTQTTDYQVIVTYPGNTCTRSGTVRVVVSADADLIATATPDQIYAGESSQLLATFPLSTGQVVWAADPTLSATNIPNPVATPTVTTTYTVQVATISGCIPEATVTVRVLNPLCEEPFVFFPTGFSPNNDGENDILRLEGRNVIEVYWVIYNRWGEKVFETTDLNGFWDGSYKGQPQPNETYGYYLRALCPNEKQFERKGNVTLFR
jgi:gliding motility-associated-like protein